MITGHFFALPKGFHLGVFLVGAGVALGGIRGHLPAAWLSGFPTMRSSPTLGCRR